MKHSEQFNEVLTALGKAQSTFKPALKKTENIFYGSKYADLASVVDATRPSLIDNGLVILQGVTFDPSVKCVGIETMLAHTSGQWIGEVLQVPIVKNDAQGVGSAITYGRRYGWQAIVGIAADVDDDGNAAADVKGTARDAAKDVAVKKIKAVKKNMEIDIRLVPYKEGWLALQGHGLSVIRAELTDEEKLKFTIKYDADINGYLLKESEAFSFSDVCKRLDMPVHFKEAV